MQHSGLFTKRHYPVSNVYMHLWSVWLDWICNLRKLGTVVECLDKVEYLFDWRGLPQQRYSLLIERLWLFCDVFLLAKEKEVADFWYFFALAQVLFIEDKQCVSFSERIQFLLLVTLPSCKQEHDLCSVIGFRILEITCQSWVLTSII